MSTGTAFFLIAVGAILRFAFATTSTHGLDVHVVGVILILIGVVGLVLSLVMSSPLNPRRVRPPNAPRLNPRPLNARRMSLLNRPRGRGNPGLDEIKETAAENVAMIQEDDKFFRPAGPDGGEDDL